MPPCLVFLRKDRVAATKGRLFPVEWRWASGTPPRRAMARTLDGKAVAAEVRAEVAEGVEELRSRGRAVRLDVILVGEDPASVTYVRNKQADCAEVGMETQAHCFPEDAAQEEIEAVVERLNDDEAVSGFFIQLPLPDHLDSRSLLSRIRPDKDVDGLNPQSAGRLAMGLPALMPCTPHGIVQLLQRYGVSLEGEGGTCARPVKSGRQADDPTPPARKRDRDRLPLAHAGPGRGCCPWGCPRRRPGTS